MPRLRNLAIAIAALLPAIVLVGCWGFVYENRLVGKYGLVAVDIDEEMSVVEMLPSGDAITLIGETVFAVGWNDEFIIAKQHPYDEENWLVQRDITNFFILSVLDGEVIGPLNESSFVSQRTQLGVPGSLEFTLIFRGLQ